MVNHSALCRSIKYDYINILTWTILKKIQILNGCDFFAFKYSFIFYEDHNDIFGYKYSIDQGNVEISMLNFKEAL